jgi:hypothetical protein
MVDARRPNRLEIGGISNRPAEAYWHTSSIGGGVWRRQTHDYSTVTVFARLRG